MIDFPFKGDEQPLREMEHAELILINTQNGWQCSDAFLKCLLIYAFAIAGRPTTIKPGKPVYRYVFEKLVHGESF